MPRGIPLALSPEALLAHRRKQEREKHARLREKRAEAGLCRRCGRPPVAGATLCEDCRAKTTAAWRRSKAGQNRKQRRHDQAGLAGTNRGVLDGRR